MKVRSGFVSNSSSSSFILCLKRKPTSAKEMHSWMFPHGECEINPFGNAYSSKQIADQAYEDIIAANPITFSEFIEELLNGNCENFPDYPHSSWNDPHFDSIMMKYREACSAAAARLVAKLTNGNQNMLYLNIEYGDENGGIYAAMEHGDVFSNIKHTRISHH